ncbi:MAG: hypothetical protein VX112_01000 [Pseudomonadota bacterium]|nr:hypothetical protein [Pseudomonadota bacterium]
MTRLQRVEYLNKKDLLTPDQAKLLQNSTAGYIHDINDSCSENVIGAWPFPFSVVQDFPLAWGRCCLPMVIEETSVVAAMNKSAKYLREQGRVKSKVTGKGLWGQLLYFSVPAHNIREYLQQHKVSLISFLQSGVASRMASRGGGVLDIRLREIKGVDSAASHPSYSIDYLVDSVDALGANFINQVGHVLSQKLALQWGVEADVIILSNHQPHFFAQVQVVLYDFPEQLGVKIAQLSTYAMYDIYRAVTHNKGIMNGVDAVLLATGNDWRAQSAAVGAYASQDGAYKPLSSWVYNSGELQGQLSLPIACATVGGVVSTHPLANLALAMLGNPSKHELMQIVAQAGLLQNLSALRALVGEGINAGHMRLHIQNFIVNASIPEQYRQQVTQLSEDFLRAHGRISPEDVLTIFRKIVKEKIRF